jgi:hypothetical protein
MPDESQTINRTPNPDCSGCQNFTRHTPEEMREFHPLAGHGYTKETGWTLPELEK